MKNLLLTFLFFFLIIFQINAQYIALYEEPEIKISQDALNWENQKLRSDLTLSDNQFQQIKSITLERSKARSIVAKMFKYEPKKLETKLQEIDSQFDGEFAQVLNDKQYKKYLTLQARKASQIKETEEVAEQAEGPNFNARIQEMISKATTPAIDPSLLPKQDTSATEMASGSQDSLQIQTAGLENENIIARDPAVIKENTAPVNKSEPEQEINTSEKEALNPSNGSSENTQTGFNKEKIQNSEE